jgi:hypothetical protein
MYNGKEKTRSNTEASIFPSKKTGRNGCTKYYIMCATPKVIGHSDVPLSLREFLECGEPNKAYLQIFNI